MKLSDNDLHAWRALDAAGDAEFATLVEIAGLDPKTDFKGADFSGVDFGKADLRAFDFEGADLTNANLSRARISTSALNGARLTGALLPPAFSLRGYQLDIINAVMSRLRHGGRRALVSAPSGIGVTRIVQELLQEFRTLRNVGATLVVTTSKSEAAQLLNRLKQSKVGPVEPLESLVEERRRLAACYVTDHQSVVRLMKMTSLEGTLAASRLGQLICVAANLAAPKAMERILLVTADMTQIAFAVGDLEPHSYLAHHFEGNRVYDLALEDARHDGLVVDYRLVDAQAVVGSRRDRRWTSAMTRDAVGDFLDRLARSDLLLEKSLVLCSTVQMAHEAADAVRETYRRRGLTSAATIADASAVPDSREEASFMIRSARRPHVICATYQMMDNEIGRGLAALAVLVGAPSATLRQLWDIPYGRFFESPLLVVDYTGAARESLSKSRLLD